MVLAIFGMAFPFLSLAGTTALALRLLGARAVFSGFSRALIAVASREMCPTRRSSSVLSIGASCGRLGKALPANSAKARENVASLGTAASRSQPRGRRAGAPRILRPGTPRGPGGRGGAPRISNTGTPRGPGGRAGAPRILRPGTPPGPGRIVRRLFAPACPVFCRCYKLWICSRRSRISTPAGPNERC